MSYCTRRSESSASRRSVDGDTTEDGGDDRDETKRKSRNLSEKKRRDQFNILVNELSAMVSTSSRKMDKSTVLKATIAFLKAQTEQSVQSQVQETQEDWKPSFLSNEEFTHLMLEALDGFIVVFANTGKMLYLSESITSLLGHLPSDLVNCSIYNFIPPEEKSALFNVLNGAADDNLKGCVSVVVNFKLGGLEMKEEHESYQLVKFVGYYNRWISGTDCKNNSGSETTERSEGEYSESNDSSSSANFLIATGRLVDSDLMKEMSIVVDAAKSEFSSRHSLEWKFLFLDHRAPPIIGYLPFEVLGTSGYDYYHVEDLEKVATCHESLMQKGEGTSCYYRFLTKGQQWIWLQTRFYITYHQWNSKPEFIVCTHRVVSYADVMKDIRGDVTPDPDEEIRPSIRKHVKSEHRKCHSLSLRSSSKSRNGSISYGSVTSKRNSFLRKLDLPPKFMTTLSSSSQSMMAHPSGEESDDPLIETVPEPIVASSCTAVAMCPQPFANTVAVALHPHLPQFVPSSQMATLAPVVQPAGAAAMALPLATFQIKPLPANPTFAPVRPLLPSQCLLQEQLMYKHAELQRQIIQQQEELRRVSEQLLLAQCGMLQADPSILIPQSTSTNDVQQMPMTDTQQQYSHQTQPEQTSVIQFQQGYANVLQYQPSIVNFSEQHQQSIVQLQHPGINDGHNMM